MSAPVRGGSPVPGELFLILSVERTEQASACVFWRENASGYTTSLGDAGRYTILGVKMHADPPHHVAIPLAAIEIPASKAKALVRKALKHGVGRVSRFAASTPAALSGQECEECGESCPEDIMRNPADGRMICPSCFNGENAGGAS